MERAAGLNCLDASSGMEVLDIVDGADRVVDQAPRDEVHAKRLLHRMAFVIAKDRSGVVYLNSRAHGLYRGCLDVLSEHVRSGERYDEAAWRGLKEEYGVPSGVLAPLFRVYHESSKAERGFGMVFEYTGKPVETGPEVAEVVAVPVERLRQRLKEEFTPWGSSVLQLWLNLTAKGMEKR